MNPLLITGPKDFPWVYLLVAVLYVVLAIFANRLLRRRLKTSFWTMSNAFFFFVFCYCVLRSLILLVWPLLPGGPHHGGWIGVFDLPNLGFFLAYSTLLMVWAEFTWGARPKRVVILRTCSPRFLYSIVNAVSFLGTPVLWIASADDSSSSLGRGISTMFHFALNTVGAVAFFIVGKAYRRAILRLIRKHPVENEKYMKKKSRQLWWFVFLGVACFTFLALFQFVCGRLTKDLDWTTTNVYLFLLIFKSELVLLAMTVWSLDGMPPKHDKVTVPPPPPEPVKKQKKQATGELEELKVLKENEEGEGKEEDEKKDEKKKKEEEERNEEVESLSAQIVAIPENENEAYIEMLPVSHGGRQ
ncbi:hypothetical protein BSKO_12202 [Bryopsis sp. KO-2023]|nr:hypothetical protein BSKO_12202 [Bryopsis sp. KO-2023]